MISLTHYGIAFSLGLFSTLHCWGMCGGIIGALSMSLPANLRDNSLSTLHIVSAYNLGRISSYTLAGALFGAFAYLFLDRVDTHSAHLLLQIVAGMILVILGLHIAGWLPGLKHIEGLGYTIWQYLQPLGRVFLPVDSGFKALFIGMLWGWLPCGLVYATLLWAVAGGDPVTAALSMLAFGLGTLPGMIAAGMAGGFLRGVSGNVYLKRFAGVLIICFGIATPLLPLSIHQSHHHTLPQGSQQHGLHCCSFSLVIT
ncbi:MAG: sulfite exporter TauE/SafE family protein [Gammaproteobacteria bacterium]